MSSSFDMVLRGRRGTFEQSGEALVLVDRNVLVQILEGMVAIVADEPVLLRWSEPRALEDRSHGQLVLVGFLTLAVDEIESGLCSFQGGSPSSVLSLDRRPSPQEVLIGRRSTCWLLPRAGENRRRTPWSSPTTHRRRSDRGGGRSEDCPGNKSGRTRRADASGRSRLGDRAERRSVLDGPAI